MKSDSTDEENSSSFPKTLNLKVTLSDNEKYNTNRNNSSCVQEYYMQG